MCLEMWFGNGRCRHVRLVANQWLQEVVDKLESFKPGSENRNAGYRPKIMDSRWLINGAVIAAALMIGLSILKNMKSGLE